MPIKPDELRSAMRRWATGVTVVSAAHEGTTHGMTASSFTSLSLDPPYVMVSLERTTRTHDLVASSGVFGVTILSDKQKEISNHFAIAQSELGERFEGIETFKLSSDALFIKDAIAFFDCRVVSTVDAGTHTVFIGEVIALQEGDTDMPLMYFNQGYRELI